MSTTTTRDLRTFFFDTPDNDDSESDYASEGESLMKSDSSSSSCAEIPYIIEHILDNRHSNAQLPLRAMFSINSGQPSPKLKDVHQLWQSERQGLKVTTFLASIDNKSPHPGQSQFDSTGRSTQLAQEYSNLHNPLDRFMDEGNEEFWEVEGRTTSTDTRRASQGLPPSFVEKIILSTIFKSELDDVDFGQALAGLDYIRDFEQTRRCFLREAAERLNITAENWRHVLGGNERALEWIEDVLEQEASVETHHRAIFVNIRIWTMIHELKSCDPYKPNTLAMLNTLFPPKIDNSHSMPVKSHVLHQHRARLYHCLVEIENQPPARQIEVLETFVRRYFGPSSEYSWQKTRAQLEQYMKIAIVMMQQAKMVHSTDFFARTTSTIEQDDNTPIALKAAGSDSPGYEECCFDSIPTIDSSRVDSPIISPPLRNPLRAAASNCQPQLFNSQNRPKPKFRARSYSDSMLLNPRKIREASTELGALLTIPTTDLQKMILDAIKNVSAEQRALCSNKRPGCSKSTHMSTSGHAMRKLLPESRIRARLESISHTSSLSFSETIEIAPLNHRRTNAALPFMAHWKQASSNSITLRPNGASFCTSDVAGLGLGMEDHILGHAARSSISSEKSPRLPVQSSFGNSVEQRGGEAEAYIEARFPNYNHHRISPMQPPPPPAPRSRKDSVLDARSWSRNTSFTTRPSTSLSQHDRREDYWPSPKILSAKFSNYEKQEFGQSSPDMQRFDFHTPLPGLSLDDFVRPVTSNQLKSSLKKQRSFAFVLRPSFTSERSGRSDVPVPRSPAPERAMTSMGFRPSPDTGTLAERDELPLKKQRSFGIFPSKKVKKRPEPLPIVKPYAMAPPPSPSKRPPLSPYNPNAEVGRGRTLRRKISGQIREARRSLSSTRRSRSAIREFRDDVLIARPYTSTDSNTSFPIIGQTITKISSADSEGNLHKAKSTGSLRSLFRRKSKEVILTSEDIREPFPPYLQESLTKHTNNSMPDLRNQAQREHDLGGEQAQREGWWVNSDARSLTERYIPISDEPYEEFQRKENTRRWFLEEARAKKKNQDAPGKRPSWEDELQLHSPTLLLKEKKGGLKKALGKNVSQGKLVKRHANDGSGLGTSNVRDVSSSESKRPGLAKKASSGFMGLGFSMKRAR